MELIYFQILLFMVLIIFQQQQIFLHYLVNVFLYHCMATMISLSNCNFYDIYLPIFYLVYAKTDLIKFWKALIIVIPFLSFKRETQVYVLRASMTHNKNRYPLSYLLINCVSAKSASQLLFLKVKYTLLLLKFPNHSLG